MSSSPPADWYPDPHGAPQLRYWDGREWTEHVSPVSSPAAEVASEPAPEPARKRRGPLVPLLVSAGIVVVLGVATAFAWGPVSAVLFPTYTLAQSGQYQLSVRSTLGLVPEPVDPLAYPQSILYVERYSPGYLRAVGPFVEAYIEDYTAENGSREFSSKEAADRDADAHASEQLRQVSDRLLEGGQGLELGSTGFPQVEEILAVEQEISAVPVVPGADGSYWDAAEQVVEVFGSRLTEDLSTYTCLEKPRDGAGAAICSTPESWGDVYVLPRGMAERLYEPYFVDMAKHEIAHKLIYVQCAGAFSRGHATWDDAIGEGVTSSYAVLFLGADAERLQQSEGEYHMDDATYAQAQALHDSDLACYDGGQLPAYRTR
jgi:hypothetical protein